MSTMTREQKIARLRLVADGLRRIQEFESANYLDEYGDHLAQPAQAVDVARRFHEAYERLAPSFGYETRADTRAFDPESPNGKLMIAVCAEVTRALSGEKACEHDWAIGYGVPPYCNKCGAPASPTPEISE